MEEILRCRAKTFSNGLELKGYQISVLSGLLRAKHNNLCSFIGNVMPDDTKDYQNKSYREKVKLKPHIIFCCHYPANSGR